MSFRSSLFASYKIVSYDDEDNDVWKDGYYEAFQEALTKSLKRHGAKKIEFGKSTRFLDVTVDGVLAEKLDEEVHTDSGNVEFVFQYDVNGRIAEVSYSEDDPGEDRRYSGKGLDVDYKLNDEELVTLLWLDRPDDP